MKAEHVESSGRVIDALSRLRDALSVTAPALATRLAKPATAGGITGLELALGRALPDELRAFYSVADGDGPTIEDEPDCHGLLFGAAQAPRWVRQMRWLSVRDAKDELRQCRDTIAESFAPSWIPIAADDNGNFVVVDAESGTVMAVDHESPEPRAENRLASSIVELLEEMVRGIDNGIIRCDRTGLFPTVAAATAPTDPATVFVTLLVERGLLALAAGRTIDDAAPAVRIILVGRGRAATKANKLARLFEDASWVDETFASEEVLEVLVEEFR
jgi:cell wall assembly regulator SMI1